MNNENRTPHWLNCPICEEQVDVKVYEDTILLNFPLDCPKCKAHTLINVIQLKMLRCK